jgi:hypothetical protein
MIMFHRIEMNVIHVMSKVVLIPDRMLPETRNPDTTAPFLTTRQRHRLFGMTLFQPCFGKFLLDESPALRIFGIPLRQGPDGVKMIGKQDRPFDREGILRHALTHTVSEECTSGSEQDGLAVFRDNGEEEGSTLDKASSIVWHRGSVADGVRRVNLFFRIFSRRFNSCKKPTFTLA